MQNMVEKIIMWISYTSAVCVLFYPY